MDIEIDYSNGTATFFVDIEANSSKTSYRGIFKVKCVLSPLEYVNANAMHRQLLGEHNPQLASDYIAQLCYAMSQLKYRVMSYPGWFENLENGIKGSHLDDNILLYILDRAVDAEQQYRKGVEDRYESAKKSAMETIDEKEAKEKQSSDEEIEDDLD